MNENGYRVIVGGINANTVIVNKDGVILAVNQPWIDFGLRNDAVEPSRWVGKCYFDGIDYHHFDDDAKAAVNGLQAVLDGQTSEFLCNYPCHSTEHKRWFHMVARRVGPMGDVLVCHHDRTLVARTQLLVHAATQMARRRPKPDNLRAL